ncbi:MAG TPA: rod shape-determining protein MreC [Thermoanaerobaculia bacterium]|nr:rod shape-determining protein MreC [Thermoanaerobaculia bacterium]
MSNRLGRPLLFLLLGAQLALLTWQVRRTQGSLGLAGEAALRVTGPVARTFGALTEGLDGVRTRARQRQLLAEENAALRAEVGELRRERLRLEALELEADRLAAALDFQRASPLRLRVAEVVYVDHAAQVRSLVLRSGEPARLNQPVVDEAGLVGRVISTAGAYARVQLLTDRAASLGALLEKAGSQGLLRGGADGRLRLDFVPRQLAVEVGDRVLTAGIDGVFPPGLPVGAVTGVEPGNEMFQTLLVTPAVDFRQLGLVYLVDWQAPPAGALERMDVEGR